MGIGTINQDGKGVGKLLYGFLFNNRDQKAQLLLVNIAIAADILELFELMKEAEVKHNFILVSVVMTLWTCSLIQVIASVPNYNQLYVRGGHDTLDLLSNTGNSFSS